MNELKPDKRVAEHLYACTLPPPPSLPSFSPALVVISISSLFTRGEISDVKSGGKQIRGMMRDWRMISECTWIVVKCHLSS